MEKQALINVEAYYKLYHIHAVESQQLNKSAHLMMIKIIEWDGTIKNNLIYSFNLKCRYSPTTHTHNRTKYIVTFALQHLNLPQPSPAFMTPIRPPLCLPMTWCYTVIICSTVPLTCSAVHLFLHCHVPVPHTQGHGSGETDGQQSRSEGR